MDELLDSPLSPRSHPSGCSSASSAPDSDQMESKGSRRKRPAKVIYYWNSGDVNKWLRKHCGQYHKYYGDTFLKNDISGPILVRLSDSKLQLMGITNPTHRDELMRHIYRVRLKTEAQELRGLGQRDLIKDKKPEKT